MLNVYRIDPSATGTSASAGDESGALPQAAQHADVAVSRHPLIHFLQRVKRVHSERPIHFGDRS